MKIVVLLVLASGMTVVAGAQSRPPTNPPPTTGSAPGAVTSTARQSGKSLPPESRPKPLDRPSARFSLLFLQYRRGDADAAIDTLSKWTEGEVIAEAVPSPNDDAWTRATLVSFLTETGMRKGTFGQFSDYSPASILLTGWGLDKNFEIFSFRSYTLIKDLARAGRKTGGEALLRFCGKWYGMGASFALRFRSAAREGLQAMGNHDLKDVPEVPLFIGSYWESRDGPYVPTATVWCRNPPKKKWWFEGPDGCVYAEDGSYEDWLEGANPTREALWGFRTAIKLDPTLSEARLRLGHILHMLGRNVQAAEHYERALQDSIEQNTPFVTYMAGLMLGELEGQENRWDDAVKHIRLAVAAAPTAHIGNVGLGEALLKSGNRAGWDEARHMFDDEDQLHAKKLDPWFYYRFAQYWRLASDLREMRQVVRRAK